MAASATVARASPSVPPLPRSAADPLGVTSEAWGTIVAHAARAYPEEACGFLISPLVPGWPPRPPVVEAEPAENERPGDRRRGFVISAATVAQAESSALRRGRYVSGFYHSHPDLAPVPSRHDATNAWPGFVYVIVRSGPVRRPTRPRAYVLDSGAEDLRELVLGPPDDRRVEE